MGSTMPCFECGCPLSCEDVFDSARRNATSTSGGMLRNCPWTSRRSFRRCAHDRAANPAITTTGRVRFTIVAMLFAVTMVNYGDRATLAMAGPALAKDLGLSAVQMGLAFSAFGWSYVIGSRRLAARS